MSYENPRITLNDDLMTIVTKLSDGNPGAVNALIDLFTSEPVVDPESVWQGYGPLMALDNLSIYGDKIWILYKDNCNQNARDVVMLLRANQLGFLTDERFIFAVDYTSNDYKPFTKDELLKYNEQVCKQLSKFKK